MAVVARERERPLSAGLMAQGLDVTWNQTSPSWKLGVLLPHHLWVILG